MSLETGRRLDRIVVGFFSSVFALIALYLGLLVLRFVGPPGWAITGVGIVAASAIAFALARVPARRTHKVDALRSAVVGVALSALAAPLLVNQWIRGDYDRYIWVIHQRGPCGYMGSGPGVLVLFGAGWVLGIALLGLAVATHRAERRVADVGIATGAVLIVGMALVLFVDQALFARLLGCV